MTLLLVDNYYTIMQSNDMETAAANNLATVRITLTHNYFDPRLGLKKFYIDPPFSRFTTPPHPHP